MSAYVNLLGQAVDAACQILGHHAIFHSFYTDLFQHLGESGERQSIVKHDYDVKMHKEMSHV